MARATRSKKRSLAIPKGRHIHEPIRLDSMFHGDICSKAEIIDSRLRTKAFYTVKFRGLFFLFFPVDNNATGTLVTGKSRPTSRFANTHATVFRFIYIYISGWTRDTFRSAILSPNFAAIFFLPPFFLFVSPRCKQISWSSPSCFIIFDHELD